MYLESTIARSTSARRCLAFFGLSNGLYALGACGRPASSADSARFSCETSLSNSTRADACTPTASWPPTVVYGTLLR